MFGHSTAPDIGQKLVNDSYEKRPGVIGSMVKDQTQGLKEGFDNQVRGIHDLAPLSHEQFEQQKHLADAGKPEANPDHKGMEANRKNEEAAVALFAKPVPDAYAKAEENTFKHVNNPHQVANQEYNSKAA